MISLACQGHVMNLSENIGQWPLLTPIKTLSRVRVKARVCAVSGVTSQMPTQTKPNLVAAICTYTCVYIYRYRHRYIDIDIVHTCKHAHLCTDTCTHNQTQTVATDSQR